ncbi:hypothetical protein L249_3433 [Ophiocordyceps polyrhachis-furcata BCC 54312]|uniref:Telomerase reverse transcriptase n=1 Tax=Ophiocordyceps polyrhachis-furcata BCC 54312 TaxID=1330021 RepID=A0A367LM70_9HYPO|nr:hypothetical protein L249_3433 [Ophiocordyceps polyrhachis-furcata BCC 54312]
MSRGVKRKRKHREATGGTYVAPSTRLAPVQRDLLQQQFPTVQSLRAHLICKLPISSRLRRKKIALLGVRNGCREIEADLARVLDSVLVCSPTISRVPDDGVYQQFLSFSQRTDDSNVSLSKGLSDASQVQADIVDFVVWRLFRRHHQGTPNHILCDGFRRTKKEGDPAGTNIHGIFSLHPNPQTVALKCYPWPNLLALLGQSGQTIMIDLLLHCFMFEAVEGCHDTYLQLSGAPLSTMLILNSIHGSPPSTARKPSDITLVRSRVLYSRPVLTAVGRVRPGFSPFLDVLNKCPHVSLPTRDGSSLNEMDACNELNTRKLMMHLFPRQFGLCNVFTPKANSAGRDKGSVDYATREAEFAPLLPRDEVTDRFLLPKVPKRLRGVASHLVQQLQVLHARCSYTQTLDHYCPTHHVKTRTRREMLNRGTRGSRGRRTTAITEKHQTPNQTSIVDAASPASHVSAFCQAVVSKIIPNQFWGDGVTRSHNRAAFLRKVDHFIKLRRFESMSLHEICQGIKVTDIAWLGPPSDDDGGRRRRRLSQSDTRKREEIFHEFLYFAFDSLLIALIRGCFYVTESNTHSNQVFYFRHDVWRLLTAPAIARFRGNMFEELNVTEASRILESRTLGCGHIRLLPKGGTFRLIMNLKRKNNQSKGRSNVPGPSINSVLRPVHCALNFEKHANPSKLRSSLMSVGDIYARLKQFKKMLGQVNRRRFYFVKVDVHAAFDTIPQEAMTKLMSSILSQKRYTIKKHAEIQPSQRQPPPNHASKPPPVQEMAFHRAGNGRRQVVAPTTTGERRRRGGGGPPHTILVENVVPKTHEAESLRGLMKEHVENNLVRIGNKVLRQSRGIPQGSILSSFLCSYFYADLETRHLGFLHAPDCLLMRLIDDFLLITLDQSKAVRFLRTMHRGLPDYGVTVSRDKTLVNFETSVDDVVVPRLPQGTAFPYCGLLIDDLSLDISKDTKRSDATANAISRSLTVDFGRSPGHNFQRKMLNAFARRSHPMLFDTSHNSKAVVLQSLKEAFCDVSHRMWAYIRCLPRQQRPNSQLIIGMLAHPLPPSAPILTSILIIVEIPYPSWLRRLKHPQFELDIRRSRVSATAHHAFLEVLMRKQTGYGHVISWLQMSMASLPKTGRDVKH